MVPSYEDIIERLNSHKLWDFPGGVHPDDKKTLSNTSGIQRVALPDLFTLPLRQHVGMEGGCIVDVGDRVKKGQPLTQSTNPYAVPVHAPSSGEVVAIAPHVIAHPSGLTEMCISIRPDGEDSWTELAPMADYRAYEKSELIEAICNAGISGLGGAGFPTHIKTSSSKPVEFLIINGIECEPYITADDRLMREYAWQIRQGIDILTHLVGPKAIVIAVEDNKPEAIEALRLACQDKTDYRIVPVETKYPAGGEKQLIQIITGREVPRNGLPADIGILMFNVGTAYAIADAIISGKPLIERVVTLTGEAAGQPCNVWARLGTPVGHLLDHAEYQPEKQRAPRVIMGGPMMGFALADLNIPIVKITNCLLVPGKRELADDDVERPCIRCSECADACPASLLPQQLFWHAKAKEHDKVQEYNLFDCIECGACAYVCPSEIPLVHYYRQAKSAIRLERDERNKAEKARLRFEARKARLEQEKREREERHRKAKEARMAASENKGSTGSKDKVAAALARAKAKKQSQQSAGTASQPPEDKKAQVAAAVARAKAKKATRQSDTSLPSEPDAAPSEGSDDKQEKVAAAIARAKAKKAQRDSPEQQDVTSPLSDESPQADEDDKKQRVAAAVARAKAKKQAREASLEESADSSDERADNQSSTSDKDARIAAAVARAKAKKAQRDMPRQSNEHSARDEAAKQENTAEDEKRQRIAAAVAKAKAKKAARNTDSENE
ncbi:electron transport complex subunit RsxC [Alteromonas halophila]|nr:electron transport complex subunit RsxC [Alteromonas halophila]